MTVCKCCKALLGFAAGIVIAPLVATIAPFFLAWFLYNESDEDCCQ